jgi:hypothetical protein
MKLLRFFRRRTSDADLSREIAAHLEAERAENLARGLRPEEADRCARIKFGSARRVHEDCGSKTVSPLQKASSTISATP